MDLSDRAQVNALAERREKLLALKTSLTSPSTVAITVNSRTITDAGYLNTTRANTARANLLTLITAEITDVETALADLDVQV